VPTPQQTVTTIIVDDATPQDAGFESHFVRRRNDGSVSGSTVGLGMLSPPRTGTTSPPVKLASGVRNVNTMPAVALAATPWPPGSPRSGVAFLSTKNQWKPETPKQGMKASNERTKFLPSASHRGGATLLQVQ
jgi:hypothetical protein